MTDKLFGPANLLDAERGDIPESFVSRRRMAAALHELAERLIRIEASDAEMNQWAQRVETLVADIGERPRRDSLVIHRRLWKGEASVEDVLDLTDYDPIGGPSNPIAPQLVWETETDSFCQARIRLAEPYQGPPGRVHGGVVSWLMDSILSRPMHHSRRMGVTGTLSIRYLKATPVNTDLRCTSTLVREDGRKLYIEGAIFNGEEQTVHAEGIFFLPDPNRRKTSP